MVVRSEGGEREVIDVLKVLDHGKGFQESFRSWEKFSG